MEKFKPREEVTEFMPCSASDKSISELQEEGWEYHWSFHYNNPQQWNDACSQVAELQDRGFFEFVLVYAQDPEEERGGIAYLYKRGTRQYQQYQKDMGYIA